MAEIFGNDNKELTSWGTGGQINACKFTSGSAGDLEKISVYVLQNGADNPNNKCCLYDAARNKLANGETEEKVVGDGQDSWMDFDFLVPPTVLAATVYWIAWWGGPTSSRIYRGAGDGNQVSATGLAYDGWPASINAGSIAWIISMYCTYEEAPPPPSVKTLVQATLISAIPLIAIPTLAQIAKFAGG